MKDKLQSVTDSYRLSKYAGSRAASEDQDENQTSALPLAMREAMAGRREDVDLELLMQDPTFAREWIAEYNWECHACPPSYLVHGLDGKIYLCDILDETRVSDQEAILAGILILRGYHIPSVISERDYKREMSPGSYQYDL